MDSLIKYIKQYDFNNNNKYEIYLDLNNKVLFITFYKNFRNDKIFCDIFNADTLQKMYGYIELNNLKNILITEKRKRCKSYE